MERVLPLGKIGDSLNKLIRVLMDMQARRGQIVGLRGPLPINSRLVVDFRKEAAKRLIELRNLISQSGIVCLSNRPGDEACANYISRDTRFALASVSATLSHEFQLHDAGNLIGKIVVLPFESCPNVGCIGHLYDVDSAATRKVVVGLKQASEAINGEYVFHEFACDDGNVLIPYEIDENPPDCEPAPARSARKGIGGRKEKYKRFKSYLRRLPDLASTMPSKLEELFNLNCRNAKPDERPPNLQIISRIKGEILREQVKQKPEPALR